MSPRTWPMGSLTISTPYDWLPVVSPPAWGERGERPASRRGAFGPGVVRTVLGLWQAAAPGPASGSHA